jgi:hypothetical protein
MGNIKVIHSKFLFKFFISGVTAFALKPFIFIKDQELQNDEVLLNHEYTHILQQQELGILKFLFLYFYYYLRNVFKYKDSEKAYYMIPFEIEAYASEKNINDVNSRKYHWTKYINYTA